MNSFVLPDAGKPLRPVASVIKVHILTHVCHRKSSPSRRKQNLCLHLVLPFHGKIIFDSIFSTVTLNIYEQRTLFNRILQPHQVITKSRVQNFTYYRLCHRDILSKALIAVNNQKILSQVTMLFFLYFSYITSYANFLHQCYFTRQKLLEETEPGGEKNVKGNILNQIIQQLF